MKAIYWRKGNRIGVFDKETGKPDMSTGITPYKSINAAKRESRKLQGNNLGQGLVRVLTSR